MTKMIVIAIVVILLVSTLVFLTSCKAERYKVICTEGLFINVKGSYKAGQTVRVYFPMVATDTDYTFYLDGERIIPTNYSDMRGYCFEFTMPTHDVELTVESKNSMEYHPVSTDIPAGTEIFRYTEETRSADGSTSFELSVTTVSDTKHCMTVKKEDGSTLIYTIPIYPYESLYSYNDIYNLAKWNTLEEYHTLDNKSVELTFYYDGEYITLSSDHMPEDGEGILKYLVSNFTDYMVDDYLNK